MTGQHLPPRYDIHGRMIPLQSRHYMAAKREDNRPESVTIPRQWLLTPHGKTKQTQSRQYKIPTREELSHSKYPKYSAKAVLRSAHPYSEMLVRQDTDENSLIEPPEPERKVFTRNLQTEQDIPGEIIPFPNSQSEWPFISRDPSLIAPSLLPSTNNGQGGTIVSQRELMDLRKKTNLLNLRTIGGQLDETIQDPYVSALRREDVDQGTRSRLTRSSLMDKRKRERLHCLSEARSTHQKATPPPDYSFVTSAVDAALQRREAEKADPFPEDGFRAGITGKITEQSPGFRRPASSLSRHSEGPLTSTTRAFFTEPPRTAQSVTRCVTNSAGFRNQSSFGLSSSEWDRNANAKEEKTRALTSLQTGSASGPPSQLPMRWTSSQAYYNPEKRLIESLLEAELARPPNLVDDPLMYSSFSRDGVFRSPIIPRWKNNHLVRPAVNDWEKGQKYPPMPNKRRPRRKEHTHIDEDLFDDGEGSPLGATQVSMNQLGTSTPGKGEGDEMRTKGVSLKSRSQTRSVQEMRRGELNGEEVDPYILWQEKMNLSLNELKERERKEPKLFSESHVITLDAEPAHSQHASPLTSPPNAPASPLGSAVPNRSRTPQASFANTATTTTTLQPFTQTTNTTLSTSFVPAYPSPRWDRRKACTSAMRIDRRSGSAMLEKRPGGSRAESRQSRPETSMSDMTTLWVRPTPSQAVTSITPFEDDSDHERDDRGYLSNVNQNQHNILFFGGVQ
ncbi:hypothetical protein BLNAU_11890 [Blattamonas nauphoetae]|uniref:Uncharacterized protein n=1 Tax=Blattamonas nauphoetae TaxID=2049346 RepID=A0ABQ9XNM1_9EUKA|nr:hypothetical protein BLNAU_11890 [Blattamonas nauphoetae]